jgi:hypothetical protein
LRTGLLRSIIKAGPIAILWEHRGAAIPPASGESSAMKYLGKPRYGDQPRTESTNSMLVWV